MYIDIAKNTTMKNNIAQVHSLDDAVKLKNKNVLVLPDQYHSDIGLMKLFARGNSVFLIDLGRIIENYGFRRAIEMAKMRRFLLICIKYEIAFALGFFAKDEFSTRNSQELCNIATLIGLNIGQAKFGLERLKEYIK